MTWFIDTYQNIRGLLAKTDHKELKSILTAFGLKQLIKDPTRVTQDSRSLIDVIYTNEPWNIYSVKVIPAGLSDHDLVGCIGKIHNFKYQPKLIMCGNYANYDPVAFCNELRSSDFGSVFTSSCETMRALALSVFCSSL